MKTPFKLRSGNTSSFKNMGSSPAKQIYGQGGLDDAGLSKEYMDDDGNRAQDQKNGDVLYIKPPRFNQGKEGPLDVPIHRPIELKRNLA